MEIRKMSQHDLEQIANLEKMCFSDPWSVPMLEPELTNPLSYWFVAVQNGQLIGYVGSQAVMDAADMMNIAVHPAYRRQGIAELLVNALISELQALAVQSLALEVRVSNTPAIQLYKKLGFEKIGLRPGYYRNPKEDAYILRKEWI